MFKEHHLNYSTDTQHIYIYLYTHTHTLIVIRCRSLHITEKKMYLWALSNMFCLSVLWLSYFEGKIKPVKKFLIQLKSSKFNLFALYIPSFFFKKKNFLYKYRYRASWLEFPGGIFVELQSKCGWHLFFVTLGLLFWSLTEWIYSCQHNEFFTLVVSKFYNPFSCVNEVQVYSGAFCFNQLWKSKKGISSDRREETWNPNPAFIKQFWEMHCHSETWFFFFFFHVDGRHTKLWTAMVK